MPVSPETRARAAAIVAGLDLDTCIGLLSGCDFWSTQEVPPAVPTACMTDGPHGVRKQDPESSDHVGISRSMPATCFPPAVVLGSSWDVDLLEAVGEALGVEARALGVGLLLGPGLNLKRHPRGGRNFEYFAEDPLLSGELAAAITRGIQHHGVGACLKHFAANNQETNRMVVDEIIDERTLRELYLRAFEIAVERGRPAAVMTGYNRINGTYCSDNAWLLRDVLRGEWGFDGLVVSDWGGTNDRAASLVATQDLEMPGNNGTFTPELKRALAAGRLTEAHIRDAATRVAAWALHAQAVVHQAPAPDLDAHHALARRAAAAGAVLLTNRDALLPLPGTEGVTLIGAFAVDPRYQGAGSSKVNPTRVDNLRDALGADITYVPGYDAATGESTPAMRAEAVAAAQQAGAVVLVVGVPPRVETETRDRPFMRLPDAMEQLVHAVCAANPRTVVVLMNGGALELPWADEPAALLEAYLGGQAGGSALADVLLGRAEPGGRLAEGIAVNAAQLPADANFPGAPRQVQYREGQWVGYRFHTTFDVPAQFPFGHGLGYTTFALDALSVQGEGTARTARIAVTNTGPRPGATVVQVYVRAMSSPVPRVARELAGFARVHLEPGERREIAFPLERRVFTVWDAASKGWTVDGGGYEVFAGLSSVDVQAQCVIEVPGDGRPATRPVNAAAVASDAEFAAMLGRPVPAPEAARPFTRNSLVPDVATTRLGRVLEAQMRKRMEAMIPAEDDGTMRDLIEGVLEGMPLRGLATAGQGLGLSALDRLVHVLNGRWWRAVRG